MKDLLLMDKKILHCLATGTMILSVIACKEKELEQAPERVKMTFTAEPAKKVTKTAIDGTDVTWSKSDRISIFDGTYNNIFELTAGAGTPSATFTGYALAADEYAALYPYSAEASYDNGQITSYLPSEQYSTADASFDTMLNPSAAIADGYSLHFRNVAGIIKINVEGLQEGIDVTGINVRADKSLSGRYTIDTTEDIFTAVSSPETDGQNLGVNLTGIGGVPLKKGPYYIVALPGTYNGLTVTAVFSNDTHVKKTLADGTEIAVNGGIELKVDAAEAVEGLPASDVYQDFLDKNERNILLDFSYAGYDHGESAPAEVTVTQGTDGTYTASNGYKVYNIEDYGANGDDDISDREAFLAMLEDIFGAPSINGNPATQITFPSKNSAKAVIYFPEGNFILHTSDDNTEISGKTYSYTILIRGGDLIMKGAGRDKTTITMKDKNYADDEDVLYSSPDMIQFKHNTGVQKDNVLATVTGNAAKGSFSVEVSGTSNLEPGDWVCLYLKNNAPDVVAEEMQPYETDLSWVISGNYGVSVQDLHQVKSVSGNTVTFHEPVMHEIKSDWGWKIVGFQHYQNVGIEDLTFAGYAKDDFIHHASWEDDGAFKPLSMTRHVNSWVRRVDFSSVSEACSIITCANVSVYDCNITGNRGHAAIRSQGSSRVFIGACSDRSMGVDLDESGKHPNGSAVVETGQYHSFGISKESMGAVLWRNYWGSDANFECHATQPRATLLDCCTGGWNMLRAGGDAVQMPNHLDDLTIWNFNATGNTHSGTWIWWDYSSRYWKFLPPTIVGFHGAQVTFDQTQVKADISNGTPVEPESLYEAQLENRLGYVPGWLAALKGTAGVN